MELRLEPGWQTQLAREFTQPYFGRLWHFVEREYRSGPVYPPAEDLFRAFELCPFDRVRVVIVGQDPYHGPGQANGLSFSVRQGQTLPPSLVNIFKEAEADLGRPVQTDSTLETWARQGVLLLNSTLTVRAGQPASHAGQGWEEFTDAVLDRVNRRAEPAVFLLWGSYAQKKGRLLDASRHKILTSPHPSPLSSYRGFFGSRPFSQANQFLTAQGLEAIAW